MSMVLELCPEPDYLMVVAKGEFSLEEAKRTFLEMLEAAARHGAANVLVDGRRLTGKPEIMDRFYYGEFAARATATFAARGRVGAVRFAYVLQEPVLDPQRFGESVAVNRGMFVKAFDHLDDALAWLGTPAAGTADAGDRD